MLGLCRMPAGARCWAQAGDLGSMRPAPRAASGHLEGRWMGSGIWVCSLSISSSLPTRVEHGVWKSAEYTLFHT